MAGATQQVAIRRERRRPVRSIASARPAIARLPETVAVGPLRIFQIHYADWHKPLLDPGFVPFDNQGIPDELLEFAVFEALARSDQVHGADLWGALSWRFAEKTGLSGADLVAAIAAAPGRDVYFCNPFPQNEALYHNLWVQGETAHPDFLVLVRALFSAAGIDPDETLLIEPSERFSTANYFIGSPAFWAAYLPFVRRILAAVDRSLPEQLRATLHSSAGDARGVHGGASYLPFIVERLFALFLRTDGAGLAAHKIALPEVEAALDVHLVMLRDLKDMAWRTRSPWLAACWTNYRSLYLRQQHGKAWCARYLRAITPADIRFA
jgi:hypothetical protein